MLAVMNPSETEAPIHVLNDDLILLIFSFLIGGRFSDAARMYGKIALVSRKWKRVGNDSISSPATLWGADLAGYNVVPIMEWLCRHRPSLKSLHLSGTRGLVSSNIELLQEVQTTNLRELYIAIGQGSIDSTLASKVASECPKLEKLHLEFADAVRSDAAIRFLMIPTIKYLVLSFGKKCVNTYWAVSATSSILLCLSEMQGLETLKICGEFGTSLGDSLQIKSDTLRRVDCVDLTGIWTFCECPKLERFDLGALGKSGSLPDLSIQQFEALSGCFQGHEVLAGSMPFLGLTVPSSCMLRASSGLSCAKYEDYCTMVDRIKLKVRQLL